MHTKFATALDAVYNLLCPKQADGRGGVCMTARIVGGFIPVTFHIDQDAAFSEASLVWSALMSWTLECEASIDATVRFTSA